MLQQRVRLIFVDRRYRFASVSQAELAAAEGDEGLSVYRISMEGRSGGRPGGRRASDRWQLPIKRLSEVRSISPGCSSSSG